MTRMRKGSLASVKCPCGWHGTRCLTTTQPCPSCGSPIDVSDARARQRAANRKHYYAKRDREKEDARIEAAARNTDEQERAAARMDRENELLRQIREECSR